MFDISCLAVPVLLLICNWQAIQIWSAGCRQVSAGKMASGRHKRVRTAGKLFHINFCRVFDIQNVPIVHICQFPLENKTEINVKCLNVSQKTFVTINQQWSQPGQETISYGLSSSKHPGLCSLSANILYIFMLARKKLWRKSIYVLLWQPQYNKNEILTNCNKGSC